MAFPAIEVLPISLHIDYDQCTILVQNEIVANNLYVFLCKNLHCTISQFDRLSGHNSDIFSGY